MKDTVLFYQIMLGLGVGRSSALQYKYVNQRKTLSEKSAAYNPIPESSVKSKLDSG